MTIATVSGLNAAYEGVYSDFLISKASLPNTAAGQYFSLWTATGLPTAGLTPGGVGTGPAVPTNTTTGAINFMQQTSPITSYLAKLEILTANSNTTVEIHDRLAHQSGFVGNVTTSQVAAFDFNSLLSGSNMIERLGDSNYSDIQWWLEWYGATGATASNATLNVTYNDGTTGNLTAIPVGGSIRAGRCIPINSFVPVADQGKFIRGVNNITLSASTGAAGNIGITATRYRGAVYTKSPSRLEKALWENLSFPEIYNNSCLAIFVLTNSVSTGIVYGSGRIVHG